MSKFRINQRVMLLSDVTKFGHVAATNTNGALVNFDDGTVTWWADHQLYPIATGAGEPRPRLYNVGDRVKYNKGGYRKDAVGQIIAIDQKLGEVWIRREKDPVQASWAHHFTAHFRDLELVPRAPTVYPPGFAVPSLHDHGYVELTQEVQDLLGAAGII